jgi:predicted ATPase
VVDAEETRAAFARARELTAGADNSAERFVIYYAQWLGSLGRGEWALARETAETFRREADIESRATERVVGLRILGLTCLIQGDLCEAQAHLREALSTHDPARHGDAKFRFGQDAVACTSTFLAFTDWLLGDVGNTRARMEQGIARAIETNHVTTQANAYLHMAFFEIVRGDCDAAGRAAQAVVELAEEHGLAQYATWGALPNAYLRASFGDRESRVAEFREALEAYGGQGYKNTVPLYQGLLAELEAEGQGAQAALARIDEALALASRTGERWTDAFLHCIRGKILLKRDPTNTAAVEEAFHAAVAVAQQQKARSFELRAALHLARLCNSTGRSASARALLVSALKGFSPTPEFPEIAQAQTLLSALTS